MKRPKLSVCMIVKNEERHIARCLESVQPIADEIIVIDTGSNDRTEDICTSFHAQVYVIDGSRIFHRREMPAYSMPRVSGY